jgi:hypothetical protein
LRRTGRRRTLLADRATMAAARVCWVDDAAQPPAELMR